MRKGGETKQGGGPRAGYVHVPFCAHHCGYCDFAVAVGQDHLIDQYLDALTLELATLGEPQTVESIFLGGGTPTYLDARRLERLLTAVVHWLPPTADQEFTVEANPGTLDADKVAVLAGHGVNRVSLGAQSFHPGLLAVLERDHQPADVPRAVAALRRRIPQVSLDLIFGIPGQALEDWDTDLKEALALEPDHVSTYGLTYEKGTRLWKQRRRGEVQALNEDAELWLYLHGIDTLAAAGLEHYEISNFARAGRRSRHNQVYWANESYFGFGLGAARYVEGRRELNTRDLTTYLRKVLAGQPATFQSEQLPPEERARETLALQLRRAEGINREAFHRQTGFDLDALAGPALRRHSDLGLLLDDGASVRLTRNGKCVADALILDLL
ncbi:MAG: radical SAM family heme chaperone HemW [Planctomycetes bacterium]|nr:radical SAM family heme chaperone HemW [Planctomycetota bacterium]